MTDKFSLVWLSSVDSLADLLLELSKFLVFDLFGTNPDLRKRDSTVLKARSTLYLILVDLAQRNWLLNHIDKIFVNSERSFPFLRPKVRSARYGVVLTPAPLHLAHALDMELGPHRLLLVLGVKRALLLGHLSEANILLSEPTWCQILRFS